MLLSIQTESPPGFSNHVLSTNKPHSAISLPQLSVLYFQPSASTKKTCFVELSALLRALLKSAKMERSCTSIATLSTSALTTSGKPLTVHQEMFMQIPTKVNEQNLWLHNAVLSRVNVNLMAA